MANTPNDATAQGARTQSTKREIVKAQCEECGSGLRNHVVLVQQSHYEGDDDAGIHLHWDYQIIRCLGCGSHRFREQFMHSEDVDMEGQPILRVRVFPEPKGPLRPEQKELIEIDGKVGGIYAETLKAVNSGANTLAAGGLRAIVEAICLEANIPGRNLQEKIDGLAKQGLLAAPQAELLHEHRFIGNAALHELESPYQPDLLEALDIIETLLKTIYILPHKADRLKKRRERRAQARRDHDVPF